MRSMTWAAAVVAWAAEREPATRRQAREAASACGLLLAAMAALVVAACTRGREAPASAGVVEGTAVSVANEELVVDPPGTGSPLAIGIVPGIPIMVDGRVAAWTQIEEGAEVRVEYARPDGRPLAVRIEARSPPRIEARAPPEAGPAAPARAPAQTR